MIATAWMVAAAIADLCDETDEEDEDEHSADENVASLI